uniref:Uncharacterized protein n=1 Tax=Anas platyrhynchos platyrhynchos TaxID=8840 RepID=A0A493T4X7_ANAPP
MAFFFPKHSTDVDIFFLRWVKTPSIGFHSSFVTSLLSKSGAVVASLIIISGPFSSPRQAGRGRGAIVAEQQVAVARQGQRRGRRGAFVRPPRAAGPWGPRWERSGARRRAYLGC